MFHLCGGWDWTAQGSGENADGEKKEKSGSQMKAILIIWYP